MKVLKLLGENENLTGDEKHYLRFLLKVSNAFAAVLTQEPVKLPKEMQEKQEELSKLVDTGKLHRYLCRQVRKYHVRLHTDKAEGFPFLKRHSATKITGYTWLQRNAANAYLSS